MTGPASSDIIAVPKEWPKAVAEQYDPVRVLGRGGFASVVLAREKGESKRLVAMKVVGQSKDKSRLQSLTYAHREIDILQELSHPNIMKVICSWDVPIGNTQEEQALSTQSTAVCNTICVMALQYEKGPTLESLLQYGGALSNKFGRVVISQAMDAVAYLHYRAVIHRDIKPDNIIVTGALSKDDDIWDNPVAGNGEDPSEQEPDWEDLLKRWKVTLVDFGFARPLTPDDVKKPTLEIRRENLRASFHVQSMEVDQSIRKGNLDESDGASTSRSRSGRKIRRKLSRDDPGNESFSHLFKRRMSALGNRNFAAPEIVNKVQLDKNKRNTNNNDANEAGDLTETISEYVSDYGLMVDSYSMGFTIRYSMTGVPPYMSVEEAIQQQESLCRILCGGKKNSSRRSVRYRRISELSGEVQRLIQHLTERSESQRTSIRKARRSYPWISDVLAFSENSEEQKHSLSEISYLPLVLNSSKKN
ncbi:protein kinase GAF family protein [Nitzschia inconspicua]|uniref:Protein kinase GAF family protein n=1 Tax=Nitzschia inconspicua TaxID=303405 RepID=A0A9K3KPE9_9STRA|nr:protein kinase GAF family protein [Nitzschia inconspicua]